MDAALMVPAETRFVRAYTAREYLGVGYLASYLESHGLGCEIIYCNSPEAPSTDEAARRAVDLDPGVIGISVPTLLSMPGALALVLRTRELGYRGHITLGGHVPTFRYRELLEALPGIDSVVRGEGELTFLELTSACVGSQDWREIQGLALRANHGTDGVLCTAPRPLIRDLDSLPPPARPLSTSELKRTIRQAEVCTSRGCYGRCTFCSMQGFYGISPGPAYRFRAPDKVVDEIEMLVRQGARDFFFVDDSFAASPGRLRRRAMEIAHLIAERDLDISFTIQSRADDIEPETFAALKRAGLASVLLGFESCVESALERVGKGVSLEQNLEAVRTLADLGIDWELGFLIYDPHTTFDEMRENIRLLRKHQLYRFSRATFLLSGMAVFPGSAIEGSLESEGRLKVDTARAVRFAQLGGAVLDDPVLADLVSRVYYTYAIEDPRAEAMRQMIDLAFYLVTMVHDRMQSLELEWRTWLARVGARTGAAPQEILEAVGEPVAAFDAAGYWVSEIGSLVMQLLEDVLECVEGSGPTDDPAGLLQDRITAFVQDAYPAGLDEAEKASWEVLRQPRIELTLDGVGQVIELGAAGEAAT